LYFDSDYDKLRKLANTKGKLGKDMTVNKKPFENVFLAAKDGDVNVVRKIVSENPKLKDETTPIRKRTLLIFAVLNRHILVVKYLVEAGAEVDYRDKLGKNAKDYAMEAMKDSKGKQ
jgi:ankyrin repeat protein